MYFLKRNNMYILYLTYTALYYFYKMTEKKCKQNDRIKNVKSKMYIVLDYLYIFYLISRVFIHFSSRFHHLIIIAICIFITSI